jgi:cell division protein FtsB
MTGEPPAPPRRRRTNPFDRLLVGIALCVMAAMMIALLTQYTHNYSLARRAARLEQHRRELIAQNEILREDIQRLQRDDRYIERLAREQLGLVRPGEIELIIVPAGGGHSSDATAAGRTGGQDVPGPAAPGTAAPRSHPAGTTWSAWLRGVVDSVFDLVHGRRSAP